MARKTTPEDLANFTRKGNAFKAGHQIKPAATAAKEIKQPIDWEELISDFDAGSCLCSRTCPIQEGAGRSVQNRSGSGYTTF